MWWISPTSGKNHWLENFNTDSLCQFSYYCLVKILQTTSIQENSETFGSGGRTPETRQNSHVWNRFGITLWQQKPHACQFIREAAVFSGIWELQGTACWRPSRQSHWQAQFQGKTSKVRRASPLTKVAVPFQLIQHFSVLTPDHVNSTGLKLPQWKSSPFFAEILIRKGSNFASLFQFRLALILRFDFFWDFILCSARVRFPVYSGFSPFVKVIWSIVSRVDVYVYV